MRGFVGGSPTANHFLLFVQKKVIKENHTPLPLISFGLSATLVRLRNSRLQRSDSPRRLTQLMLKPQARQGVVGRMSVALSAGSDF